MPNKQVQLVDRQIANLRAHYSPTAVNDAWEEEIAAQVHGVINGLGLNEVTPLADLIKICTKWSKQKNPEIILTGLVDPHDQEKIEKLISVFTPRGFVKIITPLHKRALRAELFLALQKIFHAKKVDINYLIKELEPAVLNNDVPGFSKIKNKKFREQLRELIKTHGATHALADVRFIINSRIHELVQELATGLNIHNGLLHHEAIALMQERFNVKTRANDNNIR